MYQQIADAMYSSHILVLGEFYRYKTHGWSTDDSYDGASIVGIILVDLDAVADMSRTDQP